MVGKTFQGKPVKYNKLGRPYIVKSNGMWQFLKQSTYGKGKPTAKAKSSNTSRKAKTMAKKTSKGGKKKRYTARAKGAVRRAKKGMTLGRVFGILVRPRTAGIIGGIGSGGRAIQAYMAGDFAGSRLNSMRALGSLGIGIVADEAYKKLGYPTAVGKGLDFKKGSVNLVMPLAAGFAAWNAWNGAVKGAGPLVAMGSYGGQYGMRATGFNPDTILSGDFTWNKDMFMTGGVPLIVGKGVKVVVNQFDLNKTLAGSPVKL